MLEKRGIIRLTESELKAVKSGQFPERVLQEWGLTQQELKDIVESQQFETETSKTS
jgi:hypothetical protein